MGSKLLPVGIHKHLKVEHSLGAPGSLHAPRCGSKFVVHTEEPWADPRQHTIHETWYRIDSLVHFQHSSGFEAGLCLGGRPGHDTPVLVQTLELDRAGRALQHPRGTLATNGANCIQLEICASAALMGNWRHGDDMFLKAIANVIRLVNEHRTSNIPPRIAWRFVRPDRMGQVAFMRAGGIIGHRGAPSQPEGHTDPGQRFPGSVLVGRYLGRHMPHGGHELRGFRGWA